VPYEWRDHTAEVELAVEASTPEAVFADAADAFGRLVEREEGGERERRRVELSAADLGALLVDWLEELIYLADRDSFVPDRTDDLELRGTTLSAEVSGRRAALSPLVKAATYHRLEFRQDGDAWLARVVLDV
jgi:SHS2 domain-containing protein